MKEHSIRPFWLWITLLSLDAPLVAFVWQDFAARCYPSPLPPAARWALALTVWAIYLADRLIDVRLPAAGPESTRHRFYRQHRGFATILLLTVLFTDMLIALIWLRPVILHSGLMIAAGILLYFVIFVFARKRPRWKQASAASLFTSGVFLVAWAHTPKPWQVLGGPAIVFWTLCLGNLLLVERWEQGITMGHGWIWMSMLALFCVMYGHSRWYAAVAASGGALAILDFRGGKISGDARRFLADAVLLTPFLFR